MEAGFTALDWQSINTNDAAGNLFSKILKIGDYLAKDGTRYRVAYCQSTNYGSTPPETWGAPLFLIPTGWWALGTVFHDAAFGRTLLVVDPADATRTSPARLTEFEANALLDEMLRAIKPNPTPFEVLQREAIHAGLTIGGWHAWREDAP